MAPSKWNVQLISTDHDLNDLRRSLLQTITGFGFHAVGFEQDDFRVEPGVHSHEACVESIKSSDIVVLVIDRRFGGAYLGSGDLSVTEVEYNTACENGKIVIPCIRNKAEQERFEFFGIEKTYPDARQRLKTKYVDSWEVLDFIEKVRKAYEDNFIIYFDDPTDLADGLRGRLQGLSRFLLQKIVETQMSETARMKTTTGMAFSLGDVIDRGYYLEPSYKTRSGALPENTNTSDISKYLAEKEESLAVLGQPGSGKSTLLGKLFLDAAENARGDKSCCLPLFVLLRGRGATFEFDLYKYLEHSFNSLLQKELYPLLDLADFKFVLYIDGFDELTEDVNSLNTSLVFNSNMFDCQFIISCRKRFALEHLDQTDVGDKISVSIELESWDIDQIAEYIDRFCKLNDCGDMKVAIIEAFSGSFADDEVTANQLLLTLFLWIVEESGMKVPLDVSDKTSLFDKTLELWAKRELVRTGEEVDSDDLIAAWKIAAWHIYCSRYDTNGPLTLEILRQKIETNSEGLGIVCTKEAFNGLLDVRPYTQKILGLLHEQILEHLAAHAIFNGIYSNSYPFPESLSYVVRHDINRIVRGFWEDGSVDKQVILDNLNNHYVSIAQNDDSASILQRNQAAYYMGRLGTENAIEKLRLIDDTEDNLVVKLSIAFGLIGCGQFDYEATLLQNLKDNGDWDKANRGYHLVYYHDWRIQEIAPPYLDPEDIPWSNTLRSLMRHIESTSFQHIALRRVEIYTIRRFLETRGTKGPLDDDVIMKLEASVGNIPSETVPKLEGDFITNLEEEIAELRKVYDSM